ncbi:MAG TPA: 3-hydroxyacyl-CoA dehydrogenase NAD-binding domain-containing protein [Miltoncostaeaceae bacterium]|nr:3-hydroxyacyl-CoA dehydrogenase NAD-binding domain-containing protein [Miltoncostaeaceae bacterium]
MPRAVVVGAGAMGPEIAAALAATGTTVALAGRDRARTGDAVVRAGGYATAGADAITAAELVPETFAEAALVIETISEDLDAKRALYRTIEPWCPTDALIATNTSSLRIGELAEGLERPERFAGLHFLKPAHLTGVVEVIPGPRTGADALHVLVGLAEQMGKAPLVVRADEPGFIWNRIQFAVLRECLHMLELGIADAAAIDAAVSDGLAPRWVAAGPLATADLGGLATFATVSAQLNPHLAANETVADELVQRAAAGEPFAPWTEFAGEAVGALRAQALRAGREIAATRRAIGG